MEAASSANNWDTVVGRVRERRRGLAGAMSSSSSSEYSTSPSPSPSPSPCPLGSGSDSGSSAPSTPLSVKLELDERVTEGANQVGKNTCEPDPEVVLQANHGDLIPPPLLENPGKFGSSSLISFASLSASHLERRTLSSNEDGDDESQSSEEVNKTSFTDPSPIPDKDSDEDYENEDEDESEYLDMHLVRSMFNDDNADNASPPLAFPPLPSANSDSRSHEKSHSISDSSSNRRGKLRPGAKSSSRSHILRSISEKNTSHAAYIHTLRERRTRARLSMLPPPCPPLSLPSGPPPPLALPPPLPLIEKSYKPSRKFSEYRRELLEAVLAIESSFGESLEQKGAGSETNVGGMRGITNVPGEGGKEVRSWVGAGNETDAQSTGKISSNVVDLDFNANANADRLRPRPSSPHNLRSRPLALLFPPISNIGLTVTDTMSMDVNMAAVSTTIPTDPNANSITSNCAPPVAPKVSQQSGLLAPTKLAPTPAYQAPTAISLTLKSLLGTVSEENTVPIPSVAPTAFSTSNVTCIPKETVPEPKHKPKQKTTLNSLILPEPGQLPVRPLARSISPSTSTFSVSAESSGVISAGGSISASTSSSASVLDTDENINLHAKRSGREFPALVPVMGLGLRVPRVRVDVDAGGVLVNGGGDYKDDFVGERDVAVNAAGSSSSLSSLPHGAFTLRSGSNPSRSSTSSSSSSSSSTTTWPPTSTSTTLELISSENPSSKLDKNSQEPKVNPSEQLGIPEPKLTREHILLRRQMELAALRGMKRRDADASGVGHITRRLRSVDGIVHPPRSGSLVSVSSSCIGPIGHGTVSERF